MIIIVRITFDRQRQKYMKTKEIMLPWWRYFTFRGSKYYTVLSNKTLTKDDLDKDCIYGLDIYSNRNTYVVNNIALTNIATDCPEIAYDIDRYAYVVNTISCQLTPYKARDYYAETYGQ